MIPFRIDIYSKNRIVASLNSKELLKFEHYRRGQNIFVCCFQQDIAGRKPKKDGEGFWEEDFGESRDLKPWGKHKRTEQDIFGLATLKSLDNLFSKFSSAIKDNKKRVFFFLFFKSFFNSNYIL